MKFDNSFELPLPPARAWTLLLDVPRIAPCMPGAELTEVESDRSFKGKVSVRLGPVALAFAGRAVIEGLDNDSHTARIRAQGLDSKGRGGASAVVDFRLEPVAGGSKVIIGTDLTLTGSVAQYGRGAGVIREVASQLTLQFAQALRRELVQSTSTETVEERSALDEPTKLAKPEAISGFAVLFRALCALVRGAFGGKGSR